MAPPPPGPNPQENIHPRTLPRENLKKIQSNESHGFFPTKLAQWEEINKSRIATLVKALNRGGTVYIS